VNAPADISWRRYALIAELAKRLDGISPQFDKTALQKAIFLLQEVYGIDCGYDFKLYSFGPFDPQLNGDLDLVEYWGCVATQWVNAFFGGYRIRPTEKVDLIRPKAAAFLDDKRTESALNDLVTTYGAMPARELELRATTVYVERNIRAKGQSATRQTVLHLVGQVKPKFTPQEIEEAVNELSGRDHIQLAA
jgi:hypothetical protein